MAMQLTPVALDVVVWGMRQYPASMADFMDMFPTEDACLEYLSLVRWPDGYQCLRCGKGDNWKKTRGLFTCRACGYEASVLAGTVFQDTHKPLRLWFQAMWYVALADKRECTRYGPRRRTSSRCSFPVEAASASI
jgi:hypothetical protein